MKEKVRSRNRARKMLAPIVATQRLQLSENANESIAFLPMVKCNLAEIAALYSCCAAKILYRE